MIRILLALLIYLLASVAVAESSISEARFNELIDEVYGAYRNRILEVSPRGSSIVRDWQSNKVNGSASNIAGLAEIRLKGGVARHAGITEDGFRAYVCHEVGHIIGGPPYFRDRLQIYQNLSVESQADYFVTSQCLRRLFTGQNNEAAIQNLQIPEILTQKCAEAYGSAAERALCIRSAMAGQNFITSMIDEHGGGSADFATPDPNVVKYTPDDHPNAQCRVDFFLAGALCSLPIATHVETVDENATACSRDRGHTMGIRPACAYGEAPLSVDQIELTSPKTKTAR